jgi:Type IV secretion system pilin
MYKKLLGVVFVCGVMMMSVTHSTFADYYDKLTQDEQQVVKSDDIGQNGANVLREGAYNPGKNASLYNQGEITTFAGAQNQTFAYITKIVNWILRLLGAIALVYLIYNGIQMMTAAGDDAKYKK